MLSDRAFLRRAVTAAGLAIFVSFGLAVAVVAAAEPAPPPAALATGSTPFAR